MCIDNKYDEWFSYWAQEDLWCSNELRKAVQQEKTRRKIKTERKLNGSSCLPYSAVKRINPTISAASFCKSHSWENFLNPLIKLSSFFSAPYILENSQSLHLFSTFMPMAKWIEVGKVAMAWNQRTWKQGKLLNPADMCHLPCKKPNCYCIFSGGSSVFPIVSCSKQSCRSPQ